MGTGQKRPLFKHSSLLWSMMNGDDRDDHGLIMNYDQHQETCDLQSDQKIVGKVATFFWLLFPIGCRPFSTFSSQLNLFDEFFPIFLANFSGVFSLYFSDLGPTSDCHIFRAFAILLWLNDICVCNVYTPSNSYGIWKSSLLLQHSFGWESFVAVHTLHCTGWLSPISFRYKMTMLHCQDNAL